MGQSHKTVSINHNFLRERSRSGSNRGPFAYKPSALPLGHTGSLDPYFCLFTQNSGWCTSAAREPNRPSGKGQVKLVSRRTSVPLRFCCPSEWRHFCFEIVWTNSFRMTSFFFFFFFGTNSVNWHIWRSGRSVQCDSIFLLKLPELSFPLRQYLSGDKS